MQVEFSQRFSKDIDALKSKAVKIALKKSISNLEHAQSLEDLPGVKKLVGYKNAYRIRVGDYRLGFFLDEGIILCGRFVHRKNIYKLFP